MCTDKVTVIGLLNFAISYLCKSLKSNNAEWNIQHTCKHTESLSFI